MARIDVDNIQKKVKDIRLQNFNSASYTIRQTDDDFLFQIDTYSGSIEDNLQTQTIQFDSKNLNKFLNLISKEFQSFTIPLLDDNGEVKHGVNWGNRKGRNVNQAYLDLPVDIYNSDFFPTNGNSFFVRTDDGQNLEFVRAQKNKVNGHVLQTPKDNTIIGVYLRNRLSVNRGEIITKEHIKRYGRSFITVSKYGDFYYLDFSNKVERKSDVVMKDMKMTLLRNYIVAAKTKPFLLLAGISGTGKSRIVRELAKASWGEMEGNVPKNFAMVQVKPNWHDSSDLLGYVSRVSGKPEFVAGPFLRFIAKAWEDSKHPYFLCLDEMNLAPVEQYFAEYLSVIESRKLNKDGVVITDPILEKRADEWYHVLTTEITKKEDVRVRFLEEGITIPQNLIVVGTVNMDETTYSFSRKVLDRAMTIEMNEVDLHGGLQDKNEQIENIGYLQIVGTAVEGVDVYNDYTEVCDIVLNYLQQVNDKLNKTPFKIAYRTRNDFLLYVINNLPYNKNENDEDLSQEYVIARALDEITSMKILSRIEGDDAKVGKLFDTNGGLRSVILQGLKDIYEGFNTESSISLVKLDEMEQRLKDTGYTSFWS